MNWTQVYRIAWKDRRRIGGLWLAFAIFWLLCLTYATAAAFYIGQFAAPLTVKQVALAICTTAVIYAIGWAGITFAAEHEDGSYIMLRSLPLQAKTLFWGKLMFGINSTLLLMGTLGLACLLHHWILAGQGGGYRWGHIHAGRSNLDWEVVGLATVVTLLPLAMVLGLFWSLKIRKPLVALVLTGLSFFLVSQICFWGTGSFLLHREDQFSDPDMLSSAIWSNIFMAIVSATFYVIDRRMVSAWLPHQELAPARGEASVGLTTGIRIGTASFRRLFWLQSRQNLWFCVAVFVPTALIWFVGIDTTDPVIYFVMVSLAAMLGLIAFRSEHQDRRYRLLTQIGVNPRSYWFSRIFPLLIVSVFVSCRLAVGSVEAGVSLTNPVALAQFWGCLAVFSVAQFYSLAFVSTIVATAATLITSIVVTLWISFSMATFVPPALCLVPVVILPLVASYLRVPRWFRDTGSWRQWIVPLVPLALMLVGLPTATAMYRIYQIPSVELPAVLTEVPKRTQPERLGEQSYQSLSALIPDLQPFQIHYFASDPAAVAEHAFLELWLEENPEWLQQLVVTTRGEGLVPVRHADDVGRMQPATFFAAALLHKAIVAQEEGRLDEAWDYYESTLNLIRHQLARGGHRAATCAFAIEEALQDRLVIWAMASGNLPSNIRLAATFLEAWRQSLPSWTQSLGHDYREARVALNDLVLQRRYVTRPLVKALMPLAPWELARSRRLLDLNFSRQYEYLEFVQANTESVESIRRRYTSVDLGPLNETTIVDYDYTPIEDRYEHAEHVRRGIIYQLVAIAYHKTHGRYPANFDVDLRFPQLPNDFYLPHEKLLIERQHPNYLSTHIIRSGYSNSSTRANGRQEQRHFLLPDFDNWNPLEFATRSKYDGSSVRVELVPPSMPDRLFQPSTSQTSFHEFVDRFLPLDTTETILRSGAKTLILNPGESVDIRKLMCAHIGELGLATEMLPDLRQLMKDEPALAGTLATSMTLAAYARQIPSEQLSEFPSLFSASVPADVETPEIRPGVPVLNPGNGHYYEIIRMQALPVGTADTTLANTPKDVAAIASSRRFRGMKGHLVTITTRAENSFLVDTFGGIVTDIDAAWTAGTDKSQEGLWVWCAGPESNQAISDDSPATTWQGDWLDEEPNNISFDQGYLSRFVNSEKDVPGTGADQLIFRFADVEGNSLGRWEDASTTPTNHGVKMGILVEYSPGSEYPSSVDEPLDLESEANPTSN